MLDIKIIILKIERTSSNMNCRLCQTAPCGSARGTRRKSMSNPNLDLDVFLAGSSDIMLYGRIKKTCQIVRFTAVILAGWLLLEIIRLWSNVERIDSYFGPVFKKDLSGV